VPFSCFVAFPFFSFLTLAPGIVEELSSLKDSLQSFVSSLPPSARPRVGGLPVPGFEASDLAWGSLRNLRDGKTVALTGDTATIGRSTRCSVLVEDSLVPSMLARMRVGGDGGAVIECLAGAMCLNDVPLRKMVRMPLRHHDQITFVGNESHLYSFFAGAMTAAAAAASAVGGGSAVVAPSPRDSGSAAPFAAPEGGGRKRTRPLVEESSKGGASDNEADLLDYLLRPSAVARSGSNATEPRAAAQVAAGTVSEEMRQQLERVRADMAALVVRPADNVAVFDTFPYHVAEPTKQIFLDSVAVFLARPELASFAKGLSLSPGLVLEGPFGTELIQTELVLAVAKALNASVMLIDAPHPVLFPDPDHPAATDDEPSTREGLFGGLLRSKLGGFGSGASGASSSSRAAAASSVMPAASLANPRKTRFRKGDRVRFSGDGPVAGSGAPKGPEPGMLGEVAVTFEEENRSTVGVKFDRAVPGGISFGGVCDEGFGYFCSVACLRPEGEDCEQHELESATIDAMMAVAGENAPCILCIRDVEGVAFASYARYKKLQRAMARLPPGVVVVGLRPTTIDRSARATERSSGNGGRSASSLLDFSFLDHVRPSRGGSRGGGGGGGGGGHGGSSSGDGDELVHNERAAKMLSKLLPTRVSITAPVKNPELAEWKRAVEEDIRLIKLRNNRAQLAVLLKKRKIELDVENVNTALLQAEMYSVPVLEQALGWAVGHHARSLAAAAAAATGSAAGEPMLRLGAHSMEHALTLSRDNEEHAQGSQAAAVKNVVTENEFERKILADVIPSSELNVTFAEIGALESVKNTLRELVLLPLTRPELFRKGNLTKPSKGVLLFGPPGTGKTMLAKAVATECKANFINVSMASIGSKWFGEGEKYAQAIFTLASKISPSVIFIDEVDSILGKRGSNNNEHEAMRKIKNTIMSMWDGLTTSDQERVIVLAATNRPFDLDDAVLRRLPRRMLVDLPDAAQREQILRVICAREEIAQGFDFSDLARQTEGYSGSDLRNLCVAAAYIPVREILEEERKMGLDPHKPSLPGAEAKPIRALRLGDFVLAKDQISSSVSEDCQSVAELRQWNATYGEGGDRKKISLTYFM
jgi:SpoVK/Ycf46/Vps4 family AAA+-type ATPase